MPKFLDPIIYIDETSGEEVDLAQKIQNEVNEINKEITDMVQRIETIEALLNIRSSN